MADCEIIKSCPFALGALESRPDQDKLTAEYCKSNNLHCARYMVYSTAGEDKVPADLYPDEKNKAYLVIAESS